MHTFTCFDSCGGTCDDCTQVADCYMTPLWGPTACYVDTHSMYG